MRTVQIYLSAPFQEVLASLLTLPTTRTMAGPGTGPRGALLSQKSARCDAEVKEALRSLYEAAHGRQVETQIGSISIAPPLAGFLKEAPYSVATQHEFFLEAFTRILARDSRLSDHANGNQVVLRVDPRDQVASAVSHIDRRTDNTVGQGVTAPPSLAKHSPIQHKHRAYSSRFSETV